MPVIPQQARKLLEAIARAEAERDQVRDERDRLRMALNEVQWEAQRAIDREQAGSFVNPMQYILGIRNIAALTLAAPTDAKEETT